MSRRFELVVIECGLVYTKRWVRLEEGERLMAVKAARPVVDARGDLIGFELVSAKPTPSNRRPRIVPDQESSDVAFPSCRVMSRGEVEAAIDPGRRSKTQGLNEEQRAARVRMGWSAEDLVERARAKLPAFAPNQLYSPQTS